jgi:hypothetical protein
VADSDQVAAHPDVNAFQEFLRAQFVVLVGRYDIEAAVLVRVLCEEYQRAATTARSGDLAKAASVMAALEHEVQPPAQAELRSSVATVALPARAMVVWLSGDLPAAQRLLEDALEQCAVLAASGHDYLTGRRLHLALNVARLHVGRVAPAAAREEVGDLEVVAHGDRSRWPFAGSATLRLPLRGIDRAAIDGQIARLHARLADIDPLATASNG